MPHVRQVGFPWAPTILCRWSAERSLGFSKAWDLLWRKDLRLRTIGMCSAASIFRLNTLQRDMQDTFFVERDPDMVLRTHTSSVQVREMEKREPPMRLIMPGRVFRNEAISARAHCMFHQVEGLYIDKDVSFADLKQTLLHFARCFFGPETDIRLRPSYFPFTEPSAEVDVYWGLKTEVDKRITKGTGWLEILGCGMVDPNVLEASGIDPDVYSGFAFGMGIERITMLRYQIGDLRHFFENDRRFLDQFVGER